MKRRSMQTVLSIALAAAMTLGNVPVTALAVTGSQTAADGTQTASATVSSDDPEEWNDYDISVSLTVAGGKFSDITVTPGAGYISDDASYVRRATTRDNGIVTKLVGQSATYDTVNSWDTVSGATHVSEAIKSAALTAISQFDEAVTVDKSALQTAVDAASALSQGNYTDESWSAFTSALDAAKTVLNNSDASQDDVNNAVSALSSAQEGLTEKATVNKDALSSAIEAAAALKEEDYTAETWSAFASALEAAQTVYANDAATQDEVDKAVTDLATAQGALAEKEDEDVYVLMNIPYDEFYANICSTASDIDAVTTATKKEKGAKYIAAGTNYGEAGTSDHGSTINGVTIPVKLSEDDYNAVKDLVADSEADYYVGETVTDPAVYVEASYADGKYTFGDLKGTASDGGELKVSEDTDSDGNATGVQWDTKRRDIEITLDVDDGFLPAEQLYGGYVTTTDGTSYPLLPMESMYKASGLTKIGWSMGGKTSQVNSKGDLVMNLQPDVFSSMKGKTLNTVTVITKSGIVTYSLTYKGEQLKMEKDNEESEDIYVLMNIPYSEFYKLVGAGNVDVTSAATTKVRINDRAGGSYNGGGEVQSDDTSKGVQSKGVQFPVKVSEELLKDSKYTEVTDDTSIAVSYIAHGKSASETLTGKDAMIQEDDYAYYKLSETPTNYVELTSDGFSAVQGDVQKADASNVDVEYGTRWGTYEIDLPESSTPAGAVVVKTDKLIFGLKPTQHFWKYHELAWTPTDGLEATNGAIVESVTVYSTNGVVEYDLNQKLEKQLYTGKVTATLFDDEGTVSGLPSDISDAKVTVSYTEGTGRNAKTTTYVENAELKDGTFTIPEDAGLEKGTEYTVSVSSSNYTDISAKATYSESVYVLMNIPYADFYKAVGAGDVDVTSSATAKVRNSGVAGATYNGGGNATNLKKVADTAKGVQFPVKVSADLLKDSKYSEVTDSTSYNVAYSGRGQTTKTTVTGKDALIQADDYAYYTLSDTPANYLVLTSDGFSSVKGNVKNVEETSEITYGSHWGTYQLDLDGISGKVGAVVVKTDKLTFGLKATDYIWRSMEIAWSPEDGLKATNGATLQSLTVYTDAGVYEIAVNQKLKNLYSTDITASLLDETGTVSGLPKDIADAKATVSYTEGSGRSAKTTNVVENADIKDGTFAIPADANLESGKEYTVTVSSSNYLDLKTTDTYGKTVYVLMNIPYADFYKAAGAGDVDVTSSATAKVRNSGVAGATYNGGGNATNTSDVTDTAKGVQFPVKVSEKLLNDSKYTEVTDDTSYNIAYSGRGQTTNTTVTGKDALIQADDYAYYKLSDTPANYVELTSDGFSSVKGDVTKVTETSDITYGSHWGTYQLDLDGISGKVGAVVVKTDKLTFGLKPTDYIWRSMEIAWSPEDGLEATNGATLQSLTVYTDSGVYEIAVNQKLKNLYSTNITASLLDDTGTVSGLPSGLEDAKVTVSYTEGSGRQAKTTNVIENAELKNGKFAISEDAGLESGKEYTVTVSSSNYLNLSAKAEYSQSIYVLMNIPYSQFYDLVGVSSDVDVTSGATAKVRIADRAGATYNGGGDALDARSDSAVTLGGQIPVRVSEELLKDSKYTEVTDDTTYSVAYISHGRKVQEDLTGKDAMIQAGDYAYYKLSEKPSYYFELTSDGFSPIKGTVNVVDGRTVDITYGSHWGSYVVDFGDFVSGEVAAVKVTTDKLSFGLKPTQHLWRSSEIAWNPEGVLEATNGSTIKFITVYTADAGVYQLTVNQKLKSVSGTEISAKLLGSTGSVSGLPDDIADAKVTVSYTEGSGRSAKTTKVIENAEIKDGTFTISNEAGLEDGKTYDVTVSSSNYLDLKASAVYDTSEYVLMNIPYSEFYKLVGAGDVDVTSSATAKVRNSGVAGATYNGGGNATNTTGVMDATKGVQFPVKAKVAVLADSKYTEVTDDTSYDIAYSGRGRTTTATVTGKDALIQADDYAYYKLSETPANYLELTSDGFSSVKGNVTKVTETSAITYGSHWGTYQLDLDGISGKVGAVVVKTDKLTFGLKPTDYIWRSMEIAWSPEDGLEATNGANLESLTVYTDEGVYEIAVNQQLKSLASASITAALSDETGTVTGLPDDIKDAKVTVSYSTGSGRQRQTTKVIDSADLTNGSFAVPKDADLEAGKEYTVTVSSSNYVDLSTTAVYNIRDGWVKKDNTWYLYKNNAKLTGWQKVNGTWYYLDTSTGAMKTGWLKLGNTWYYLKSSGAMATGWLKLGNTWYYLKSSGAMAEKEWINGYWLSNGGAWTYKARGSWKKNKTGWWYGDTSGWYAKNETVKIDGTNYRFNEAGYWVK